MEKIQNDWDGETEDMIEGGKWFQEWVISERNRWVDDKVKLLSFGNAFSNKDDTDNNEPSLEDSSKKDSDTNDNTSGKRVAIDPKKTLRTQTTKAHSKNNKLQHTVQVEHDLLAGTKNKKKVVSATKSSNEITQITRKSSKLRKEKGVKLAARKIKVGKASRAMVNEPEPNPSLESDSVSSQSSSEDDKTPKYVCQKSKHWKKTSRKTRKQKLDRHNNSSNSSGDFKSESNSDSVVEIKRSRKKQCKKEKKKRAKKTQAQEKKERKKHKERKSWQKRKQYWDPYYSDSSSSTETSSSDSYATSSSVTISNESRTTKHR